MLVKLHKCARTTPAICKEIQESSLSERAWRKSTVLQEPRCVTGNTMIRLKIAPLCPRRSMRTSPGRKNGSWSNLRNTLLLSLDDLLAVTKEFINPKVSRSGLDRCLRRHGVANLRPYSQKKRGRKRSNKEL